MWGGMKQRSGKKKTLREGDFFNCLLMDDLLSMMEKSLHDCDRLSKNLMTMDISIDDFKVSKRKTAQDSLNRIEGSIRKMDGLLKDMRIWVSILEENSSDRDE